MAGERPRPSPPPAFSFDEREKILGEIKSLRELVERLKNEVGDYAELADEFRQLRGVFDSLDEHVRNMMEADLVHVREIGELKRQAAIWAMHAGGQVGGLTGSVAGTDAARIENTKYTARATVICAIISAVVTVVVLIFNYAVQPVKPTGATVDQETRDRVERLEHAVKRDEQQEKTRDGRP